jgi:hypothetical protein
MPNLIASGPSPSGPPELAPDHDLPPGLQVNTGPDLTSPGHRLDRIGGHDGGPVGDQLAIDRDPQVAHASRSEQVRTRLPGAEQGVQHDAAALAPADAGRDAIPPGKRRGCAVLGAQHGPVGAEELQPQARLARHRIVERAVGRRRHRAPDRAALRGHDLGRSGERKPGRSRGWPGRRERRWHSRHPGSWAGRRPARSRRAGRCPARAAAASRRGWRAGPARRTWPAAAAPDRPSGRRPGRRCRPVPPDRAARRPGGPGRAGGPACPRVRPR